ncbi:MAG TPA: hypothetical protein VHG92_11215 [Afifellaceae bacterium]|nr:hypothetical protein [Afifellaceae bacterium]
MGGFSDLLGGGALTAIALAALGALLIVVAIAALAVRRVRAVEEPAIPAPRNGRLAVTDTVPVEGGRRLVLVRRDNVEHLILIGGPRDVVVEGNIVRQRAAMPAGARPAAARPTQPQAARPATAAVTTTPAARPVPPAAEQSVQQPAPAQPDPALQERLRAASTALALRQTATRPPDAGQPAARRDPADAPAAGAAVAGLAAGIAALTAAAGVRPRSEPGKETGNQTDGTLESPAAASVATELATEKASAAEPAAPLGREPAAEEEAARAVFGLRSAAPAVAPPASGPSETEAEATARSAPAERETATPESTNRLAGMAATADTGARSAGEAVGIPDAPQAGPSAAEQAQSGAPDPGDASDSLPEERGSGTVGGMAAMPDSGAPAARDATTTAGAPPAGARAAEEPQAGTTHGTEIPDLVAAERTSVQSPDLDHGRAQRPHIGVAADHAETSAPAEPKAPPEVSRVTGETLPPPPTAAAPLTSPVPMPAAALSLSGAPPLSGMPPGRGTTLGDLAERLEEALIQQAATGSGQAAVAEAMPASPEQPRDKVITNVAAEPRQPSHMAPDPPQPSGTPDRDEAAIIDFTARRRPGSDSLEEEMARLLGELTLDTKRR